MRYYLQKHYLKNNPGNDLLFHTLRHSTIGANSFHGRVRYGIGCLSVAMVTRKSLVTKLFSVRYCNQANRVISTGKLHALLHFHTQPINVVVFHDSNGEI